jgi:hypothetical protein
MHPNGSVVLLPKLPVSTLRGIIKPRQLAVTIEEMAKAAASGATQPPLRRKRR